ncbi:MAG: glycerophosphoryl diester phosphodiesterase membrane domain-containing protein [Catonella sp.]|uniref:glycerophosphoryl diester phosphodiesterase membrane domain-containing protein n=1 Tax=Catonella sp. TaxID=2382125 RepID=UPI003FA1250C
MNIDNKALGKAVWNNIYQNKFAFYSKAVLLQLILTKVGSFLLRFVFRLVLASAGEDNLTAHNILDILSKPPSFLLLIIFVMLVSGFILLEFSVLTIMVYCSYKKVRFLWKNNLKSAFSKWRSFNLKQMFFFIIYFILMIPLSNLGLSSVFSEKFFIPKFITSELMKTDKGEALYYIFLLICGYINLRLIFTIPLTVINNNTFSSNMKRSLEITKKGKIRLIMLWFMFEFVLFIVGGILLWLNTQIFEFLDPSGKAVVYNSMFYTITRIILFFFIVISKLIIISSMVKIIIDDEEVFCFNVLPYGGFVHKKRKRIAALMSIILIVVLGHAGYQMFSEKLNKNVFIVGHRGYDSTGVENSIEALEGAAKAGADYVELDIILTKDNKFVVIHDFNLKRLAGIDKKVQDMTFDEVVGLEIRQGDFVSHIPSFEEFVKRAKELNMKLLVELKPHGKEPDNYADIFINEMRRLGVDKTYKTMSGNLEIMEKIEAKAPDIDTGHIIAMQFGAFADEMVNFFVIEDFTFNDILNDDAKAKGKDIFVWTINDSETIIKYLHKPIEGIITDYPDMVKEEIENEDNSYFLKLYRLLSQGVR